MSFKSRQRYRSKADIPYFQLFDFSEVIEDKDIEFTAAETMRVFNPESLERFSEALITAGPVSFRFKFKIDLAFKSAARFIDADTYFMEGAYKDFLKTVLKPVIFFKRINFDKITLAEAEYIISKFAEFKYDLKNKYEYLYNPPIRAGSNVMSAGAIEREAFSEHYGPYIEMVYILCKGDFTKFEEIIAWDLNRFLYQAEYLIRKRDTENIK